ncbi:RimK/LysX family protein [Oleiagrimonas sp. C23AA]|uniref:ATP-dependent zinc protease family protein n=1 Tax=Oleiagrimonas sp. C23AA TaxID=2719047 RepID=UPI001423D824|nr:RimK/LysX family protein [Oleiagrimonas sp. C23AA]NII09839.1 ATP-dependent zinc protease [Oleiagrimonas sp. C23AA]
MPSIILLGWREWLALPDLGIPALRAKLDTGARSSSLHVESLETFRRHGDDWLRFAVRSYGRRGLMHGCEMPACDRRRVTDAGGHSSVRWFIRSAVILAGESFEIELNLADRRSMRFPMLVGRSALEGRFAVDPAQSYVGGHAAPSVLPLS